MADFLEDVIEEEQQKEKTFTQAELDRIIAERVSRVKKELPEDYEDLKAIAEQMEGFGYTGTAAEKKAAIKAYREEVAAQSELEDLQTQAEIQGTSPELLAEIREAKKIAQEAQAALKAITDKDSESKRKAEEAQRAEESAQNEIKSFQEAYPDVDLDSLNDSPKFIKFVKNHTGSLADIYEQYVDLLGETEKELITKVKNSEDRSTGGGNSRSNGMSMSAEQKQSLEEWNERYPHLRMTPKEFMNK